MARFGGTRTWVRAGAAIAALAVVAGAVVLLVMQFQPERAMTADGARAQGTVSGPNVSGARTYDNRTLRFRFSFPDGWLLRESGATQASEGEYITVSLVPKSSTGTLSPPKLEVVPDPQGFSTDAIVRMKWGSGDTTLTVTTSTVEVAGVKGIEVRASSPPGEKPLYTYEANAIAAGRLYLLRFETADAAEFEKVTAEARRVLSSLQTY